MDSKNSLWVRGVSAHWCPRCLASVMPEQEYCNVCGYGQDVADINVGNTGYDDYEYSGLLDDY